MADNEVRKLARQFKGLWIPAEILALPGLTAVEKMLWADIDSFTGNNSTWFKTRETAAQELGVSLTTVSRSIKSLIDAGIVDMIQNDGRHRHFVATLPSQVGNPVESKRQGSRVKLESLPSQNETIDNKRGNKEKTPSRGKPESLEDVVNYFAKRGCHDEEESAKFMDYYTANGWTQGRGKPIKDWMATARNWMRNGREWKKQKGTSGFQSGNFTADGIGSFITHG